MNNIKESNLNKLKSSEKKQSKISYSNIEKITEKKFLNIYIFQIIK